MMFTNFGELVPYIINGYGTGTPLGHSDDMSYMSYVICGFIEITIYLRFLVCSFIFMNTEITIQEITTDIMLT